MSENNLFPLVASAMIFVSFLLLFAAIFFYSRYLAERKKLVKRIESDELGYILREASGGQAGSVSDELGYILREAPGGQAGSVSAEHFAPVLAVFQGVGKLVRADKRLAGKGKRLTFLQAGIRSENAIVSFWGAKYAMGILFPALFLVSKQLFIHSTKPLNTMLLGLCLVMAGFYIPDLWLKLKTSRRKEQIQDGLPDALDLLVICVEAGMGLDQAINRVGEEMRMTCPEISDEFRLFNLEVRAGKAKRNAFKNLALRTDLEDVNSLVTMLVQTETLGTSIANSLRVYSDTFRTKRMQKAEEIAAKLPVKLLFPLVFFIFPCLFITILGPGVIRIVRILIPHLHK